MKRTIIILLLILGILGTSDFAFAISSNLKSGVSKLRKNKDDDKKFELSYFWENYMDEYLSSYVFKALANRSGFNPTTGLPRRALHSSQ